MIIARPMLYNLEALRGICALMVAVVHIPWASHFQYLSFVENAWLFVDFFFVLSGFIIALNYACKEGKAFQFNTFILRRFFRLYPLHLFMLMVFLALIFFRETILPAFTSLTARGEFNEGFGFALLLNLLLSHALGFTSLNILNTPSWSISTEFYTYIIFAICCIAAPRPTMRVVSMLCLGAIAFSILVSLNGGNGLATPLEYSLPRCIASFSLGTGVWLLSQRFPASLRSWHFDVIYTIIFPVVFVLMYFTGRTTPLNCVMPLIFGVIIFLFANDVGSSVRRALEVGPMRVLGRWSYSIYMVHAFWTAVFGFVLNRFYSGTTEIPEMGLRLAVPLPLGDAAAGLYLITVIATSAMTYRFIEKPWRDYGVRLSNVVPSMQSPVVTIVQGQTSVTGGE